MGNRRHISEKGIGTPEGLCPISLTGPVCWNLKVEQLGAACPSCHGTPRLRRANPQGFTRKVFSSNIWKKKKIPEKPSQQTNHSENPQKKPQTHQKTLPEVVLLTMERLNVGLECNKITNPLTMVSICVSQITFLSLTQPLKAFYRWIPTTQAIIIPSLHKSCC